MKAKDVMTQRVISIAPDANVLQAARLMLQNRISGLPVVDAAGALVGIVTEGDFLRRSELGTEKQRPRWLEFLIGPGKLASEYVQASGRKVEEIMTTDLHTIGEDTPLEDVVHLMEKHRVKRLPVMRDDPLGADSCVIGEVVEDEHHFVQMETLFGGSRVVDWLSGEQLPRIC